MEDNSDAEYDLDELIGDDWPKHNVEPRQEELGGQHPYVVDPKTELRGSSGAHSRIPVSPGSLLRFDSDGKIQPR